MPPGERKAVAALNLAGFGTYIPERRVEFQHRKSRRWVERVELLLPGYVFLDFPVVPNAPTWPQLRACDGVAEVLGYVGEDGVRVPMQIPSGMVERLMADQLALRYDETREARRRNGVDALGELRASMVGRAVRITDGPFASFRAMVDEVSSLDRLIVTLSLFGRETGIRLDRRQVELAA